MKKQTALTIAGMTGLICLAATIISTLGYAPWLAQIVIVFSFPLFVLFLGLWWRASDREEDIPFIGY